MRFVLAAILPDETHERFTSWPLHITILPPFDALSESEVVTNISNEIQKALPLTVQFGELALYGNKRLVQKIIPNSDLHLLHKKLLRIAEHNKWQVAGRYIGEYYTPHVTLRDKAQRLSGAITITSVALVRSDSMGYKTIIKNIIKEHG